MNFLRKLLFITIICLFSQISIPAQSGWNLIYNFEQEITSIAFNDSSTGIASGAINAKIYETNDGGITWTAVNIPSLDDIISHLIFYNNNICFGVGKNGTIIKSIDKGKTWTVGNVGDQSELRTIYAAPGGNLFICQRNGNYIYKSTDQGISWTKTFSNGTGYQYDFGFCNENVGYLVGDAIVKTTDGGNNWFSVNNNFYSGIYKRIKFISDNIGYVFILSYSGGKIAKTTDGGNNWFEVYDNNYGPSLNDFTVSGENTIWVIGYHTILKSVTSGSNWIHQSFSPYTDLYKVVSINPLICYALSSVGTLYKTIDGGLTAPSLSYPLNLSTELPLNNLFRWNSEITGNPFRIQIAMNPSFNNIYLDTLINSISLQVKTPELNTVYYWRVCERFGNFFTPWSEIWSFKTITSDIPLLSSPLNNSIDLNLTPSLSWNDPTLAADSFQIQVSTDSEFNNLLFNSTTSNEYIEIQDLHDSTLYYWRVRANINNEYGAWSEVWKFSTLAKTARLLKPPNNSIKSPINNVTFEWSRTAETMEFILQISSDSTFNTNVIEKKNLTVFSTNITENLNYSTKYFWRVGAKNFDGKTYWSKVFNFYTKQAPTASFPLSLGNKWYYQAGSNQRGYYYGVTKEITDTLADGFRELTNTYYYKDSITTGKEYWGYIDGKFYIGHQTSSYVYDDYLTDDTCTYDGFSHGCRLLIPYILFDVSDTTQFYSDYFSMHGASDGNETTTLPSIGVVKTFHYSYSYSGIVTKDSTYLIGMLRNGEILGDTALSPPPLFEGAGWTKQNSETTENLSDVAFYGRNFGTVVGANGTILRTTDGGKSWKKQVSGTVNKLNAVAFYDLYNGIAVGDRYTILKTTNGGSSWISVHGDSPLYLHDVMFIDRFNIVAVGDLGLVVNSTDGGEIWSEHLNNLNSDLRRVYFINKDTGIAVGTYGLIFKTTNGGTTWDHNSIGTNNWFNDIFFSDVYNGVIVGNGGTIFKTTDGGNKWFKQTSGTEESLNAVEFIDINYGVAVGYEGEILRTSNGGATWLPQIINISNTLNSVAFVDANNGWIVGNNGTILRTGMDTINVPETISSPLFPLNNSSEVSKNTKFRWQAVEGTLNYELQIAADSLFEQICFDYKDLMDTSLTIRTLDYGSKYFWRVKTVDQVGYESWSHIWNFTTSALPVKFELYQNYPNPFNPTTKIEYDLPHFGHVQIKIYDILGREVSTLVNEEKLAGSYQVEFNGSGYASGIYFYRIQAGNYSSVKKMILIK